MTQIIESLAELFGRLPYTNWHSPSQGDRAVRRAVLEEAAALLFPQLDAIKEGALSTAKYTQYSASSTLYPRGYYEPDPLSDILIGVCRRGSIKKVRPARPRFTYFFDEYDELSFIVSTEEEPTPLWFEKLFAFSDMRVGFRWSELCVPGSPNQHFEVCVETAVGSEYTVSKYTVTREWGERFDASCGTDIRVFAFENGLPVRETRIYDEPELFDIAAEYLDERGELDLRELIKERAVTEVEYDEKGLPRAASWGGKPCKVMHKKRPFTAGMMKAWQQLKTE